MEGCVMSVQINPIIESIFKPGAITRDGFLGKDERSIEQIIREDEDQLIRLNTSRGSIADFLQNLIDEGKNGLEGPVILKNWTVQIQWDRGLLPCPFGDLKLHPKITASATDRKSKRTIRFSQLTVHLIREHGFFEGKSSPYRLEPEVAVSILNSQSN
jgi:hypothetical protein